MRFTSLLLLLFSTTHVGLADSEEPVPLASVVLPGLDAEPLLSEIARTSPLSPAERHEQSIRRVWIASMAAAVAASSADAATSWGKFEGNAFLASSNGTFGMRGVSIKAGIAAAVVVPQLLLHRHKNLRGAFTIGNFIEAGAFTGVAVHNMGVSAPTDR